MDRATPSPPPGEAPAGLRLGVDMGGTKLAGVLLAADGAVLAERRLPNPGAYAPLLSAVRDLCDALAPTFVPLGIGIPGSVSPSTGLVRNANSTFINGRDLGGDLARACGRPVRLANDANCFALSEAVDGAAQGGASVFGVILGTGVGGGLVLACTPVEGAGGSAGEWGHTPLPWHGEMEDEDRRCWCGLKNCLETWVSGPALERDHGVAGMRAPEIAARAAAGEARAVATLDRYASRLARGLAVVCNILDPEVIVLGGGVSNIARLYPALPARMRPYQFTDRPAVRVLRNRHGDASGVRGAAWLWPSTGQVCG